MKCEEQGKLIIGGREVNSRLFLGTGKYASDRLIPAVVAAAGASGVFVGAGDGAGVRQCFVTPDRLSAGVTDRGGEKTDVNL